VPEAHIDLEGGERRKLQSLKRPSDVVILEDGEPIDGKNAQRYAALLEKQKQRSLGVRIKGTDPATVVRATPAAADARPTRVYVTAPRNLWVRGPDANLELGLDPDFSIIDSDELRIFGTVRIRRGFVEVLGRRFDLSAGSTVIFTGPTDQPTLAVDATYRTQGADEKVSIVVHVEGRADALRFGLRSPEHPEYGDNELMQVIATGRLPDQGTEAGGFAGVQAASVLGGLVADKLQKALMKRLPIDVLTLEPGENLSGARLEAGTYLGDKLYVAYVGRLGVDPLSRENSNEVHLEYQLTSRWSFEATYGDARQGAVDLLWTRHY
jgi:translocation and assembly module TamB